MTGGTWRHAAGVSAAAASRGIGNRVWAVGAGYWPRWRSNNNDVLGRGAVRFRIRVAGGAGSVRANTGMTPQALGAGQRAGAALIVGLLALADTASAGEHVLQVSATVLPGITCQGGARKASAVGAAGRRRAPAAKGVDIADGYIRCAGSDPSITFRVRAEPAPAPAGGVPGAVMLVVEP